jgi:Tol biopolymer transport system component/ABC-type transport system involved in multi-copper enzyme maturation permease subunit
MFKTFLRKEIRERRSFLGFAFLLYLSFFIAFLVLSGRTDSVEILAITLGLVVLPLLGLLLGASAFDAEFRDGAWAYLASRPVRRANIWLMKYLALVLLGIVLVLGYLLILAAVPAARAFLTQTIYEYASVGRVSMFLVGLSITLLVFHVGFALSILSPKTFQVVFISLFVVLGIGMFFYFSYQALQLFYPYVVGLHGIAAFIAASFAGASFLVFKTCDFSQPRKKAAAFLKYVSVFLLVSLVVSAAWTRLGGRTIGPGRFIWNLQAVGEDINFTSNRGIFVYDGRGDAVRNLGGHPWLIMPFSISFGGERMLFLSYRGWRGMTQELWTANRKGLQRSILADAGDRKSPLFKRYFFSARLSADGTKAALVTLSKGKDFNRAFPYRVWWMNADGSDLQNAPLGVPLDPKGTIELVGWSRSGRHLLLYQFPLPGKNQQGKLYAFDLDSEACRYLADIQDPAVPESLSPGHENFLLYQAATGRRRLAILNLETFEVRAIFDNERLLPSHYRWSPDGQNIVFFSFRLPDELYLNRYELPTGTLAKIPLVPEADPKSPWFVPFADWAYGGAKIVLARKAGEGWRLSLVSADLKEEKAITVPDEVRASGYFVAAGDKVLAESRDERGLWRCDLGTGGWKKVY